MLAFRLAYRELRTGPKGFGVFLGCLFLGVFAITAIGAFSEAARSGLLADAGALLGGDLEIRRVHRPLSATEFDFIKRYGSLSTVQEMRTMVSPLEGDGLPLLVELKAVDEGYPLYGDFKIKPSQSLKTALANDRGVFGAVVEENLLQRLNLTIGSSIRLGETTIEIRGRILREPDRSIRPFTLGPRLLVSSDALAGTGLLQPGSLITYGYRLKLPDNQQVEKVQNAIGDAFPDAGWRLRTWKQAAPRVRFFLDRMQTNLTLIGLCALLVGGLGVSGAVRGYLNGKIIHIATFKCLGSSVRLVFFSYLLQILFLGAVGAGLGLVCGSAVPFAAKELLGENLPLPLNPDIFPGVVATAALFGLLIALAFSLTSLGKARLTPPSVLFRGYAIGLPVKLDFPIKLIIAVVGIGLVVLALATSSDLRMARWFIMGAAGCFLLFRLMSSLVISAARRAPRSRFPSIRFGLANLHRRGSPAASTLFSLGIGLTALVIIALVQSNLESLVGETVPEEAPAFFFLDIQPQQTEEFETTVKQRGPSSEINRYPTLRGRITAIAGTPVDQAKIDPKVRWAVRGDRFLSYTSELPPGTEISAGQWWPKDYQGPAKISLTADIATGFGIGVGDTLTINVLGQEIEAEIASLREVDWSTLKLNFAILFAPGTLENAPQTHIATVHLRQEDEQAVYSAVTRRFGNISVISTREILENVARTLDRIGGAFGGMAAVALLCGFLVLAGAVSADQHRRIHDAVIFKICGATRWDVLKAFCAEFLLLGLSAGLVSSLVGSLAAFGIIRGLMNTTFSFDLGIVLTTIASGVALTVLLGLLGTWKALGQKPSVHLRRE